MDAEVAPDRLTHRLRYYGIGDFATYWQVQQAAEVVGAFDSVSSPNDVNSILELHNARLFVEAGLVPAGLGKDDRQTLLATAASIRRTVAHWFSALEDGNLAEMLTQVDWQYHEHLLDLLAGLGVYRRCSAAAMLTALDGARIHLGDMLASKRLVENYDRPLRDRLLTEPGRAELVVRHHLEAEKRKETYLPASFTPGDSRALMEAYIDSSEPNPNYLKLIADAAIDSTAGIDAKLVVRARRRYDAMMEDFFQTAPGIKTGCAVAVSQTQVEPVTAKLNDMVIEYTFSEAWLECTLDFASILNNFQFLFEFAPHDALLTLPAFDSERSGLEVAMGLNGATHYRTGHVFGAKDRATLLQTMMYQRYLATKDIDLEAVLRWYFEEHVPAEYGVEGFVFSPSSATANYLERCRNLFAEMESVATQFRLLVEDGEIDHDVAAAGADQVRYRTIPSAMEGKYVYPTDHTEIRTILHTLFSDQSHLTYVSEDLRGDNAVELLQRNRVSYESLHEYQQPLVDKLIELGVAENTGDRVRLKDPVLFRVLKSLNDYQAVAYHHLNEESRAHVDRMLDAGWLVRRSSLLTEAEAAYFNYNLNSVDFSNGPKLRNKYQHGVQPKGEGEAQHQQTYYIALRLMVALTIKINDELGLLDAEKAVQP
ncbi:hypothetical protein H5398_10665 [Tessaracoccus sp. MC1679]|uniref:hypothetical protein n=1 Tax=Tessaracoccus sp. MC1679 TaxID=2760313 RepID=UPI001601BB08|nr:hypothetical protein [Tessaracoccus sp. MC1679]MBB1516425.1 hypothetical protein [Tessaracoccus sp. MC1679]